MDLDTEPISQEERGDPDLYNHATIQMWHEIKSHSDALMAAISGQSQENGEMAINRRLMTSIFGEYWPVITERPPIISSQDRLQLTPAQLVLVDNIKADTTGETLVNILTELFTLQSLIRQNDPLACQIVENHFRDTKIRLNNPQSIIPRILIAISVIVDTFMRGILPADIYVELAERYRRLHLTTHQELPT